MLHMYDACFYMFVYEIDYTYSDILSRDLAEKCDVLHQDLESDRLCIAQLHKDVTQTSEVHKQLCVGFGRK